MNGSGSLCHHSEQLRMPCPGTHEVASRWALAMVSYYALLLIAVSWGRDTHRYGWVETETQLEQNLETTRHRDMCLESQQ